MNKENCSAKDRGERARRLPSQDFPHQPHRPGASPPATIENIEHLLTTLGITVRFNSVKKRAELTSAGTPVSMTEVISVCILNGMATANLHEFVEMLAEQNPYNPVRDWIVLKPWDGEDRFQALCDTLRTTDEYPDELKAILVTRWLLSAAQAALAKGEFRARGVLTLQGPQGIGKTTWFASLVTEPSLRKEYLLLDHHMDGSNKDSIINAITHWMVEIGELDSSFKKDVARLKGFLTNNCDKLRRPYGRTVAEYPRRTIFAATVNEDRFLIDPTGNSRWWTIAVEGIRHRHDIDMQQVFAQAASQLAAGEQWWLTHREEKMLADYNARHTSVSVIEERILAAVEETPNSHAPYRTALEALEEVAMNHPTNAQCREAGTVLRRLYGPPKRVQGRDQWRIPFKGAPRF